MTELDNIILDLCKREEEAGCYDYEIAGIKVYNLVRFDVRNFYLQAKGYNFIEKYKGADYIEIVRTIIKSTFQLSKIWFGKRKFETLFYPFLRLDHVEGYYLDKFTDPLIDLCQIDNYIIFERGRRCIHPRPRLHQPNVVYSNFIDVTSAIVAKFYLGRFTKKYEKGLKCLFQSVDIALQGIKYDHSYITKQMLYYICFIKIYDRLLKRMEIKKIMAPSRANISALTYAAKKNHITVSEFQHGITYGETAVYSGFRDTDFTPDRFLAFGDSQPRNVYGIDESRIYNIGWAFQDYIDKVQMGTMVDEKDVLVISGPCLTEKILSATFRLAKECPDVHFVVRPHPAEVVTDEHRKNVEEYSNVEFQDPKINVAVAMRPYQNIIGENSTVLYEALTYGKKVARFCFDGFAPRYLTPEDEECFWKVNDMSSFKAFIEGKPEDKKSMKIYSKFDKELFMKIYNS